MFGTMHGCLSESGIAQLHLYTLAFEKKVDEPLVGKIDLRLSLKP